MKNRTPLHLVILFIAALFWAGPAFAENPTPPPAPSGQTAASATAPAAPAPAIPAAPQPGQIQPAALRREDEMVPAHAPAAPKTSLGDRVRALLSGTSNADLHAQLRGVTTERDNLAAQLAQERTARAALERQVADIEAALTEQRNFVKATATEIAASIGVPPEQLPAPKTSEQTANTKSRAQFDALEPAARMEFIRSGGRIVSA